MRKKITITIDQAVYDGLRCTMGNRRISEHIEELLRPLVTIPDHHLAMDALSESDPNMRKSARELLRCLPSIFRGANLTVSFQWNSKKASNYLYRWQVMGLVQAFGGHSDVFAKLVPNPHCAGTVIQPNWLQALQMAMPGCVVIGVEALREAGWTTQIQHRPSVAVNPAAHKVFSTEHFEVETRNAAWFKKVATGIRRKGFGVLAPAWALADMLHSQGWGHCGLSPDDIDLSFATDQDEAQWFLACQAFGLPVTSLASQAEPSR